MPALTTLGALVRGRARAAPWFDDLGAPLGLGHDDIEALAAWMGGARPERELPTKICADTAPRLVFLSWSDGRMVCGTGAGVLAACAAARAEIPTAADGLKLDVVEQVLSGPHGNASGLERSLYGLAFDGPERLAFLPEELVAGSVVNARGVFQAAQAVAMLARRGHAVSELPRDLGRRRRHRFATASAWWSGTEARALVRGHVAKPSVEPSALMAAARAAGAYLVRAARADGSFAYSYRPKTDHVAPTYNILRHAGTVYAMLELYRVGRDEALLVATRRALAYLAAQVREDLPLPCVVENGETKLGGDALAVIAFVEYEAATGDASYRPLARGLGRSLLAAQAPSGEFTVLKRRHPSGECVPIHSEYFPGEAVLALTRLARLDAAAGWLAAATAGARYLIEIRDAGLADDALPHDHWLLYALRDLHALRPEPVFARHALRLADAIVAAQRRDSPAPHPDWAGSFYMPPRSTPTATRMEGLCASLDLVRTLRAVADPREHAALDRRASKLLAAIRRGARFQLQTQLGPESAPYLPNGARGRGGFRRSLTNFEIRIDYVQHNLSSLLALARLENDEGARS